MQIKVSSNYQYMQNGIPVLMMMVLGDENNQLMAFANEADDYVIKPFSMHILIKRVDELLLSSGALSADRILYLPD